MDLLGHDVPAPLLKVRGRNQPEAWRIADRTYPFRCCAVCGLQMVACLQVAHLDHDAANNEPSNLAHLCPTHHGMYDAGLYPVEGIRLLQAHWQITQGVANHALRMKDAGPKAVRTRKRNAAARKAAATRHQKAARSQAEGSTSA